MSNVASNGSPTPRRQPTVRSISQESNSSYVDEASDGHQNSTDNLNGSVIVLTSSKLNNQLPKTTNHLRISGDDKQYSEDRKSPSMDRLLMKLTEQKGRMDTQAHQIVRGQPVSHVEMDNEYLKQHSPFLGLDLHRRSQEQIHLSKSPLPITPTSESQDGADIAHDKIGTEPHQELIHDEVTVLRNELNKARGTIARMDQELSQNRITKHTIDQAIGVSSESDYQGSIASEMPEQRLNFLPHLLKPAVRPSFAEEHSLQAQNEMRDNSSEDFSLGGFSRARTIWNNSNNKQIYTGSADAHTDPNLHQHIQPATAGPWATRHILGSSQAPATAVPSYSSPQDLTQLNRNGFGNRLGPRNNGYAYPASPLNFDTLQLGQGNYKSVAEIGSGVTVGAGGSGGSGHGYYAGQPEYHPQPIGTPLTAQAPEFTPTTPARKSDAILNEGQMYLPTTEPLNYRRLLDRTVSCNWRYIVDKIVCNNDQQASIFLQQKLKVGTPEQKYGIIEGIIAQAFPLMVNRFGNFLVQRCFEHGTPEQVVKIAQAIRGNTLTLSMDAFGCHVIQKAFDSVPEDYKAIMVHELLRRIPETVVHRYACHVWQKLFELRWTESPPQIMSHVNEALRGMWHEVALGETGSLVVQNIFENCLDDDKRPCIEEVLASIDVVAHGQFGNWCIQHICEHGLVPDRGRAIDHVIRYAVQYSMDQFASKVVEKCLKTGGNEFLIRYLDRVCEGRPDRPRIPLIDIASDQYGNYLIQYILIHANPQHREIVASHIRKHMVSLRGSKFGSRVGMLCTNPAVATRPIPSVGSSMPPVISQRMPSTSRFGGGFR